ncbi:MAG TPA: hypothetical protein VJ276_15590 [Thermoanaerobaculia bacterium]|nr:hypothetical protein [Thermoanaerobaculia bacterium]
MSRELAVNVLGFSTVNTDLKAELLDPVTQRVVDTRPLFRDGTVRFPKVDAGAYDIRIIHPNMFTPVAVRPIRVLPTGDTKVNILIDPKAFKNTAIEDVPDVDLGPIETSAQEVQLTADGLRNKKGGELIQVADWNAMASSISALAHAVAELTRLVAPQGHNHPEYEKKINEQAANFDTLVGTLNASMAEIQRQLQIRRLQETATKVLDEANVPIDKRKLINDRFQVLEQQLTEPPRSFAEAFRNTSADIEREVNTAVGQAQIEPDTRKAFGNIFEVAKTLNTKDHASEVAAFQRTNRQFGAATLTKGSV